jgi:hypothetical protein
MYMYVMYTYTCIYIYMYICAGVGMILKEVRQPGGEILLGTMSSSKSLFGPLNPNP